MLVAQRRKLIKDLLLKKKSVKVSELVSIFDVSEETIRRDLLFFEKEGFLKKTYGGAILAENLTIEEVRPPVQQRLSQYYKEKDAIGQKAKELVQDNQIIILDAGTTTWCVANYLKELKDMTFVTNGVNVAEKCSESDDSDIFLIGGKLIRKSMSLVGSQTVNELNKYNANIVFLGASGVSLERGFFSSDIYEAEVKKAMVSAGRKVVIVVDHSKFEKPGLISFCGFNEVDLIITSDLVEKFIVEEIENKGVEVITCKVEDTDTSIDNDVNAS